MNTEALVLELRNEMYDFLNELIDEFSTTETISHDIFNKAVNIRSNIIADDDLWEGNSVSTGSGQSNIPDVVKSVCGTNGCEDFYPNGTGFCKHCGREL